MSMKNEIKIYKVHPLYNKYAASNLGKVINTRTMKIVGCSLILAAIFFVVLAGDSNRKQCRPTDSCGSASTVQFRVIKSLIILMM